jgi:predicted nuclease of predicted toxin-antitoxin system
MPRTIRFHLDEHVSHAVAEGLRRLGANVTTTTDASLLGATDQQQLAYARAEERILFTQDQDCLALAAKGIEHSGIAYCDQNSRSIGQIVQGLKLIWEIYEPNEMVNRLEFI